MREPDTGQESRMAMGDKEEGGAVSFLIKLLIFHLPLHLHLYCTSTPTQPVLSRTFPHPPTPLDPRGSGQVYLSGSTL